MTYVINHGCLGPNIYFMEIDCGYVYIYVVSMHKHYIVYNYIFYCTICIIYFIVIYNVTYIICSIYKVFFTLYSIYKVFV